MEHDTRAEDERPQPPVRRRAAVFVERVTRQWVVLDPEGNFWILPAGDDPWLGRQPFRAHGRDGPRARPGTTTSTFSAFPSDQREDQA
jgi:hypothetical protein